MTRSEVWTCNECEAVAGYATYLPAKLYGDPADCYPAEYVIEPPDECGECGSDNLTGEEE